MADLFKSTEPMPPKEGSDDVVRTAQTMSEMRRTYMPMAIPSERASVQNVMRPRRGHDY